MDGWDTVPHDVDRSRGRNTPQNHEELVEALACVPRLHWIDARYLGSLDSWYYIIGYHWICFF